MAGRGVLLLVLGCAVMVAAVQAQKDKSTSKHFDDIQKKLDALLEMEAELENEITGELNAEDEDEADIGGEEELFDLQEPMEDHCASMRCSAGRACVITETGKGECQCVTACEVETDPRRRVCSNHNETWMTDCDLHRQRCLCTDEVSGCQDEMYKHLHIDYYGQCQELPECDTEELVDFPRRMREWLFNVMRDMADRQILSTHYQQFEKEAEEDESQKWSKAVLWKWCDLDGHPKDKVVSRHELFPLRAPLYTLEHCISPFLNSCDPDDDHRITLKEWGNCLQLDQEDLNDMELLCEDIKNGETTEYAPLHVA